MEIKLTTKEIKRVTESISKYIFLEVKNSKDKQNINWLNNFTKFYEKLKSIKSDREFVFLEISDVVKADLPNIIKNYLFKDLELLDVSEMSLMYELMAIYNQLMDDNTDIEDNKEANSEIGENYDSELKYSKKDKKKEVVHIEELEEELEEEFV